MRINALTDKVHKQGVPHVICMQTPYDGHIIQQPFLHK